MITNHIKIKLQPLSKSSCISDSGQYPIKQPYIYQFFYFKF